MQSKPLIAAMFIACSIWSLPPASARPPVAEERAVGILSSKVEIKKPKTATEEQFLAVLHMLDAVAAENFGPTERHPARGIACGECHTSGKIRQYHANRTIDEESPAKSCLKCHHAGSLESAGKMPFWVKPSVIIETPQHMARAQELLDYTAGVQANLNEFTKELPEFDEMKLETTLVGKELVLFDEDGSKRFFHARKADLVPEDAVASLAENVFQLLDRATPVETVMEARVEGKVQRVLGLKRHAAILETLPLSLQGLLKESKLELKYKPHSLPEDALELLEKEVETVFPEAVLKKSENKPDALKREWEIPTGPGVPRKVEIKAELKPGKETKIEFKSLPDSLFTNAVSVLGRIQESHPHVPNEFAKWEQKYEAKSEADQDNLVTALQSMNQSSPNGDLKVEVKYKEDKKGFIAAKSGLSAGAGGLALRHAGNVRSIKSESKFKKDLKLKELKAEAVISADQGADVIFDGIVDRQDYLAVKANLGKRAWALPGADQNGNGVIDGWDLRSVCLNFDCPGGLCPEQQGTHEQYVAKPLVTVCGPLLLR